MSRQRSKPANKIGGKGLLGFGLLFRDYISTRNKNILMINDYYI